MGTCFSGHTGRRTSRTEMSKFSEVESHSRRIDFIRDQSKKLEELRKQAIEMGRNKMGKYRQQEEIYQNNDRNTFKQFKNIFETKIDYNPEIGEIDITSDFNNFMQHWNKINIKNGSIIGKCNSHLKDQNSNKLDLSEVIFNQLLLSTMHLSKDISEFNLKSWYGSAIINNNTINTVKLFFPEEMGPDGKIKEGRKTFKVGEEGFIALAGTPTAQSKFYLLAQHPKAFPGKEVTSITVKRHAGGEIDIEYEFGSQLEQKEETNPSLL